MTTSAPSVAAVVPALSGVLLMGIVALAFRSPLARFASRSVERMRGTVGSEFEVDSLRESRWRLRFLFLGVFAIVLGGGSTVAWVATLLAAH